MNNNKVGLVLSGGGAKGAYQAGVIRALHELEVPIYVISGASIGALNGAIIASSTNLAQAHERLQKLWGYLAKNSPIKMKDANYFKIASSLVTLLIASGLTPTFLITKILIRSRGASDFNQFLENGIARDETLHKLMDQYLDVTALKNGLPLYVSAYESDGALMDAFNYVVSEFFNVANKQSEFFHVQSMPDNEMKNVLLASASLPLIFRAKQVDDKDYRDGGLGGADTNQGNTPIQPLIDCGCSHIIVTHLSDGALWSRHDFPQCQIIEIRPQNDTISKNGLFSDLMGFDNTRIPQWIEQGYQDALICVGDVLKHLRQEQARVESIQNCQQAEENGHAMDKKRRQTMRSLSNVDSNRDAINPAQTHPRLPSSISVDTKKAVLNKLLNKPQ